ncbi:MAG: hypothetical protein JJU32_09475 [Phormidium sp. BM_Day4_Bin.17]|nr:hypothetical protein [Phormidium sp. BM_Day4_Bin.17]UCJ11739.1 MAG: hypothetical protein JWS08_18680 [Phormidium sp. PBR-2020]
MPTRIFSIRHHGPGSAQNVQQALWDWQPQQLLIEGPPEAEAVTDLARDLEPPVALLLYSGEQPQTSVYYPFTIFSPEWQALQYGLQGHRPIHWLDLPQSYQFAVEERRSPMAARPSDLLQELARAAGEGDGDRWWEQLIEQRPPSDDVFSAILEAMSALRDVVGISQSDRRREAAMRQRLRQLQREYPQDRLAVICGAWHGPALSQMPPEAEDQAQLAQVQQQLPPRLPRVQATWIPWSYRQLASHQGYGAGMSAPGWYHYLWESRHQSPEARTQGWLTQIAQALRDAGQPASTGAVIEAVRLANSLAALRDRPQPGFPELQEAAQAVMLGDSPIPLTTVADRLLISDRLGWVPDHVPTTPLQQDLQQQARQLHLTIETDERLLDLDLRQPRDNQRSQLFHRLQLLGIPWAQLQGEPGLGTFRERWHLQWQPALDHHLIQRCIWGSSLETAASAYSQAESRKLKQLPPLAALLDRLFRANLPQAIHNIRDRLEWVAGQTQDLTQIANTLPPLVGIIRYGNRHQTEGTVLQPICDRLVLRCCLNFPPASRHLNPSAARHLAQALLTAQRAIALLPNPSHQSRWLSSLKTLLNTPETAGLLSGLSCRLLLDQQALSPEQVRQQLAWVLNPSQSLERAAYWLEGFLQGSGVLLIHDDRLLGLLDDWVRSLPEDEFLTLLPLLHRSFSRFSPAERRQISLKLGQAVATQANSPDDPPQPSQPLSLDPNRSRHVLPILQQLLGNPPADPL